jgi:threonyl-tRNA synthetase
VAVRPQGGGEQSVMTIQEFIDEVNMKVAEMTKNF